MKTKLLEIRDAGTFIPIVCVDMNPGSQSPEGRPGDEDADSMAAWNARKYLLRRCGYPCDGRPNIAIACASADGQPFRNDPYEQSGRTFQVAHHYIIEHWEDLVDGDVVDVEFILGESKAPKVSERQTAPL